MFFRSKRTDLKSGDTISYDVRLKTIQFIRGGAHMLYIPHGGFKSMGQKRLDTRFVQTKEDFHGIAELIGNTHHLNIRDVSTNDERWVFQFINLEDSNLSEVELALKASAEIEKGYHSGVVE